MKYEVDLKNVKSREGIHEKIQEVIPCPADYAGNRNALYHVLTEHSEPWEVIFLNWADFAHSMPGYASALKDLCREVMDVCRDLKISFED